MRMAALRLLSLALFFAATGCGSRDALPVDEQPAPCPIFEPREIWSRALADGGVAPSIAVGPWGEIAVAVAFTGTSWLTCPPSESQGKWDLLVAELDPEGRVLWAHHAGAPGLLVGPTAIGIDASGRVAVAVRSSDADAELAGATMKPGFTLASFTPDGSLRWMRHGDVSGRFIPRMAVRPDGRAIVVFDHSGNYDDDADLGFGPLQLGLDDGFGLVVAGWGPDGELAFGRNDEASAVPTSIIALPDGGALVGGTAWAWENGPGLIRLGPGGDVVWSTKAPASEPLALRSDTEAVTAGTDAKGTRLYGIALDSGAETFAVPLLLPKHANVTSIALRSDRRLELVGVSDIGTPDSTFDGWLASVDLDTGELVTRPFGGPGNQWITDARVDPAEHVVIAGLARPRIDLGEAGVVEGASDVPFVARLAE